MKARYWIPAFAGMTLIALTATAAEVQQKYPNRPIRMLVPFSAGSGTDILARIVGQKFSETWGQQVVVDNRPGGATVIGSELVAKANPDGHTLGMFYSTHAVNASVLKNLPYDTVRDFAPVSLVARTAGIMTVLPSFPHRSVQEIVAAAKAKPGQFTYGSPGLLSSAHPAHSL